MRLLSVLGTLAFGTFTWAQNSTYCTSDAVCYAVNVPESSASSGSGDIYFQISGPTKLSWIGFGQGSQMAGANIFMIYANAAGTNVTLSPRLGVGEKQPLSGSSTSDVTLLEGSGISNGMMIANVKCANCTSWDGGSMSLTDAKSKWIWSYKSGSAISSDDVAVNLNQHSKYGTTTLNLKSAAGGTSVNPFMTVAAAAASGSSPSAASSADTPAASSTSDGSSDDSADAMPSNFNAVLLAHSILLPLAFALFFPFGAMSIRLFNFKGLVWFHAGWMVFTYLMVLAGMGLGVWVAVTTDQIGTYHAIIGLTVTGALLLQPITGLVHHLLYKRTGRTNVATYPHVWWGRAVITLGIINGGFGLLLTGEPNKIYIGYGVGAGVVWLIWMVVILVATVKTRGSRNGETGGSVFKTASEKDIFSNESIGEHSSRHGHVRQSSSSSN